YVRLPGPPGGPWAGIVRCEATGALAPGVVVELADVVTAVLPPYASAPHKDARAPQNLYPIGGLERELRHRLGDAGVVYRALRRAARTGPTRRPSRGSAATVAAAAAYRGERWVTVRALGVGAAARELRLRAADVGAAWGRGGRGEVAACAPDEDTLTLAWQAA